MHFSPGTVAYRVPRVGTSLLLLALGFWGIANLARMTSGIIRHFAQPCAGCYLGAFEPPLDRYRNPAGQSEDTGTGATIRPALNPVQASQPGSAGHWLVLSDLIGAEQTSLFAADWMSQGTILPYAQKGREFNAGEGVWAFTRFEPNVINHPALNDNPMARAMWTNVPVGSFADDRLNVAFVSEAAPFTDGLLPPASTSRTAPWSGSRQTQVSDGRGWDDDLRYAAGDAQAVGTPWIQGSVPYWRVAVQKDLQQHFLQIDTYGMNANLLPGSGQSAGTTEALTVLGAGANYQFVFDSGSAVSNILSAHSTLIHETRSLDTGNRANGIYALDTFRADLSWGIADTVTPSIQYFRTAGSIEAMQYPWPGARPNSAGVIAGVTYVPWNSAGSPIQFLNLRVSAQYVTYTEFNGNGRGAGGNNGVHLSLWGAVHF